MKSTKTISRNELVAMLSKNKGVTFAHVVAFTDEHGSRVANKKKVLQKLTFRNVTIGSSYEARVERRIEGEFESQEMSGKAFVQGTNCIAYATKNESKLYLVCDQELKAKVHTQFSTKDSRLKKLMRLLKICFLQATSLQSQQQDVDKFQKRKTFSDLQLEWTI